MISPVIAITHAEFSPERRVTLARLVSQLSLEAYGIPRVIACDASRLGSLWCWREAMTSALELEDDATHVVWLPDDAIVCEDFGQILHACIEARPNDVFDCYVNHPDHEKAAGYLWYRTLDGYTGVGGCMPRGLLIEHLKWRNAHPELKDYPNDAGVNLWAMATRRPIYKTAFSLVTHDDKTPSLDGHDDQAKDARIERKGARPIGEYRGGATEDVMNLLGRTWRTPEEQAPGRTTAFVDLGRTYAANHIALVDLLEPPDVKGYWWAQRAGQPVSKTPHVYIAIPNQGSLKADMTPAIVAEMTGLANAGVACQLNVLVRDSLINRARDRLVASFMASTATHLLFWDSDIVPTEPGFIAKLLEANLPLVAGAAPFKNDTGHVVTVLDEKFRQADGSYDMPTVNGCVEVSCAGTGIMLISREVIGRLTEANMGEMYISHVPGVVHRAEWALFRDSVRDRNRLSEDWEFCQKWRDLGEHVYVHPDLEFQHIGERAYEGSFHGQFGGR